jgi:hypothetical protein
MSDPRPEAFVCKRAGERWLEALYGAVTAWSCKRAKATQRYAHLSREILAEAAEAMGKLVSPILEGAAKSAGILFK